MSEVIEPALAKRNVPVFIYNFPKSQAALARLKRDEMGEEVAGRFELYWKGLELANGYDELIDPALQTQRFKEDVERRTQEGLPPVPVDQKLLSALEAGFPSCSGVALGFDRLLMRLVDVTHIKEVQSFYEF
jgi:lysyl-tRNA synthetase class 2